MPTAFEIRPAAAEDFPAITAIYAEAVRTGTASFELDPPDVAEMARRFGAVTAFGGPYLVATGEDGVLGYAYAGAYRTRPAYRFTVEDSIYLDGRARGRGLGRALLGRLIAAVHRARLPPDGGGDRRSGATRPRSACTPRWDSAWSARWSRPAGSTAAGSTAC